MNIVVLDGYTLNPGDLSWEELHDIGETTIYERTKYDEIIERAENAEIILTNKTVLTKDVLNQLPNLKYIGVLATGFNVVDIEKAAEKNIVVTNVPSYSTKSVAQMVFAMILELTLNVGLHSNSVKKGDWSSNPDFSYWKKPLIELHNLTLGIIGYGQIGNEVAKLANSFGMEILVYNRSVVNEPEEYIKQKSLTNILELSDIVTLHLPLNDQSENMVTLKELSKMKNSAFLINTSRGPIVNENDLANALNSDMIAGAGLDVLSTEPPSVDNPLLNAKNCFITPHIAWATQASRQRLMSIAVENVKAFVNGKPINVINRLL
ncbi:MAG: D-2-hydroxyacid dehydrogenase [Bacteroidota bacterium]